MIGLTRWKRAFETFHSALWIVVRYVARRILGIRSHYAYAGSYHYLITEAFNVIGLLDAHW